VERVRRGDRDAYGELVQRYMRPAYSIAWRILENRADAEDLVQEAFLVALERIDSFEAGRPFGPWFYRILWNRGLNARESRSVRETEEIPDAAADPGPGPEELTERRRRRDRLREAMSELTERQRDVVRLHELEGFSSLEIGEMMGLSDGTVRWHLHRAREALRGALAGDGGEDDDGSDAGREHG
jgi:RNA polymerase sigma-70 factor (ECF subfamily)